MVPKDRELAEVVHVPRDGAMGEGEGTEVWVARSRDRPTYFFSVRTILSRASTWLAARK